MNRLVLFRLVGKCVQVFDEERSKAKTLLKIKKAVVSCAPYDQRPIRSNCPERRNRHMSALESNLMS